MAPASDGQGGDGDQAAAAGWNLGAIPRRLLSSVGDLSTLRVLPEMVSHLAGILAYVERMTEELALMNQAVQSLEPEVASLGARIDAIKARTAAIETGMGRLEDGLADLSLTLRPLRRARARLPVRPPREPGSEDPPSA